MTYTTDEEYAVLHSLRVKGMTSAEPIAAATGLAQREVQHVLDDSVARALARSRTGGRVEGYMLTAEGRGRHEALHADRVGADQAAALLPAYQAFLQPNRAFKTLTTRWQTEAAGQVDSILPELEQLHAEVGGAIAAAAEILPRFARYRPRLGRALDAFRGGDTDALAKPMSGSFHDVWMELHEDLLLTTGRERTEADE